MPNKKTYRLYPKAVEDLESIYLYSASEFGVKKADNYILQIETGFKYLVKEPLASRKCDHVRQDLRSFSIASHIIFFKITKYGIVVMRVLHKSMEFPRHL